MASSPTPRFLHDHRADSMRPQLMFAEKESHLTLNCNLFLPSLQQRLGANTVRVRSMTYWYSDERHSPSRPQRFDLFNVLRSRMCEDFHFVLAYSYRVFYPNT